MKPPLSPRRRRLRWTIAILACATLLGVVGGILAWHGGRPAQYRPDEANADITSTLARDLPPGAPKPLFTDVTRDAGLGDFRTFIGERSSQLPEDMGAGAAWGDFDNDGLEDLLLVSAGGAMTLPTNQLAPCALYRNTGNGSFSKVAEFPELRIHGMAAAWGDYDGDGYLDLAITGYNTLLLLHNEGGTGRFSVDKRFPSLPGFWSSASWGDYDNDRHLDLYVCGYLNYTFNESDRTKTSAQLGTAVPYSLNPSSFDPVRNLLFHNNGDGTFTEVAEKLGVANPKGRSLGGLWHDFDEDGWLDLYVANDISDNAFYHNKGGQFEDLSYSACVADYRSAMGLAAGDWARKGYDDLFISHWVGQQYALYHNLWSDLGPTNVPRSGKFRLTFMDIADLRGLGQISLPHIGWGTEFLDFDNDGWLDLMVVNGSTLEKEGPPPKQLKPEEPFLFWNQHGEFFHNVAPLSAPLAQKHVGRGLAVADFNRDGALDLLLVHLGEGVQLLRNDLHSGNWLEVRLHSKNAHGAPIGFGDGTKVIAHVGDATTRRTVSSVSYLSQNSHLLHFGLGPATRVEQLEVRWHAGETNWFSGLEANRLWDITEGEMQPKTVSLPVLAGPHGAPQPQAPTPTPATDKARTVEFWSRHRAAMDSLKMEGDLPKATKLFRAALELNPTHEDCRYYLAQCLAAQGDVPSALQQLAELTRLNPQSHRGYLQRGNLLAMSAKSEADLSAAEECLEKARSLNPEETGSTLLLAQVSLLRGDFARADQRLNAVCRTNPRSVAALFLRAFIAWKKADNSHARELLTEARQALGKDWQPKGATLEGDVKKRQVNETSPLSAAWETWNGAAEPQTAFAWLLNRLKSCSAQELSSY